MTKEEWVNLKAEAALAESLGEQFVKQCGKLGNRIGRAPKPIIDVIVNWCRFEGKLSYSKLLEREKMQVSKRVDQKTREAQEAAERRALLAKLDLTNKQRELLGIK